jgi:hypothetical protein
LPLSDELHGDAPLYLTLLAEACMEVGQRHDAWHYVDEAIAAVDIGKETLFEAEVNRMAGELALRSTKPDHPQRRKRT